MKITWSIVWQIFGSVFMILFGLSTLTTLQIPSALTGFFALVAGVVWFFLTVGAVRNE